MGAKVCLCVIEMLMSGMIEECWLQYLYIALDGFNVTEYYLVLFYIKFC